MATTMIPPPMSEDEARDVHARKTSIQEKRRKGFWLVLKMVVIIVSLSAGIIGTRWFLAWIQGG